MIRYDDNTENNNLLLILLLLLFTKIYDKLNNFTESRRS